MLTNKEIQELFELRDALLELSGNMREWLFQQQINNGTLPEQQINDLLVSISSTRKSNASSQKKEDE